MTSDEHVPLEHLRLVAIGSTNPVKIGAVRAVLAAVAPGARIESVAAASGVSDQPFGDDETMRGAMARAAAALDATAAELAVGIEGGVVENADGTMRTCAWAAVVARDGRSAVGGSLAMPLPPVIADAIRAGPVAGPVAGPRASPGEEAKV